jgi:hypothetical protein
MSITLKSYDNELHEFGMQGRKLHGRIALSKSYSRELPSGTSGRLGEKS